MIKIALLAIQGYLESFDERKHLLLYYLFIILLFIFLMHIVMINVICIYFNTKYSIEIDTTL